MTSVWEREREREVEAKAEGIACKTVLRPPFFVNFAGVNIPTEIKCADNIRKRCCMLRKKSHVDMQKNSCHHESF